MASEEATKAPKGAQTGECVHQHRRGSLQNWLHAVDTIEIVNYIAEKYGGGQLPPRDEIDGDSSAATTGPSDPRPETIFTRILDNSIIGTGIATAAAIIASDAQLLASRNLSLTGDQIRALLSLDLADSGAKPSPILAKEGLTLGDENFVYLSSSPGTLRASKRAEDRFCTVAKSKHVVMVLIYTTEKKDIAESLIEDLRARFEAQGI